jgi:dTDP-4-amino-4,6-dideoxygalactose transaminase
MRKNHSLVDKVEEVQYIKLNFLKYLFGNHSNSILEHLPLQILFTGSGRAALRIILEYLRFNNVLKDKNDQVLVPRWLCQSVINTMHRFCFPTLDINEKLKGVLVYHQYGYPQNMDEIIEFCDENNLFIIEDCANVYESYYKGKLLGTFGIGALFSFSKIFPSILGGALTTTDMGLYEFGKARISKSRKSLSHLSYGSRLLYESFKDTSLKGAVAGFQEMVYAITDNALKIEDLSLRIINKQLLNDSMNRRRENYQYILHYFDYKPEYFNGLDQEDVLPYVVPLFDREKNLRMIVNALNKKNVITGIYHFDVNRNILNPDFKKCLWVPMHQGINANTLEMICDTIKKSS